MTDKLSELIADTVAVTAWCEAMRFVGLTPMAMRTMLMDLNARLNAVGTDPAARAMWAYHESAALQENIDGRHLGQEERTRVQNIMAQLGTKTPLGRALMESDLAQSATLRWTISQRSLALRNKEP